MTISLEELINQGFISTDNSHNILMFELGSLDTRQ